MDEAVGVGVRKQKLFQSVYDLWLYFSVNCESSVAHILPFHADHSTILYIFCLFYGFISILISSLSFTLKSVLPKMSGLEKLGSARPPLCPKQIPVIQDYQITDTVLGLGINGKVVECLNKQTGMKYALKVNITAGYALYFLTNDSKIIISFT